MGMLRIPIIGMVDYGRIVIVFKNNRYSHCNLHFEHAATSIMREDNKKTLLTYWCCTKRMWIECYSMDFRNRFDNRRIVISICRDQKPTKKSNLTYSRLISHFYRDGE